MYTIFMISFILICTIINLATGAVIWWAWRQDQAHYEANCQAIDDAAARVVRPTPRRVVCDCQGIAVVIHGTQEEIFAELNKHHILGWYEEDRFHWKDLDGARWSMKV